LLLYPEPIFLSVFHRIVEQFGLEGTLKIISFQPPCHGQGPLPPVQGAPSPIQPGLFDLAGRSCLPSRPPAIRSLLLGFCCTAAFSWCPLCLLGRTDFLPDCSFLLTLLSPSHLEKSHCAVTREGRGPAPHPAVICSSSRSYPRLLALCLDSQHFSPSVTQMSDFPLQNKTTSNSLVLRLFIYFCRKKCCSVQLATFPAQLFPPVPFPAPLRASESQNSRGWKGPLWVI